MDGDRVGSDSHGAHQHVLDDASSYLRVRSKEETEQVPARDDADKPVLVVHDRKPLHAAARHQPGGLRRALLRVDGHRRRRHDLGSGEFRSGRNGGRGTGTRMTRRLPAQQIALGDDTDDPVLVVEHRQSTDVVLGEQLRHLLEGSERDDRDDIVGHQVSHFDVLHGGTPCRLTAIHPDVMPEVVQKPRCFGPHGYRRAERGVTGTGRTRPRAPWHLGPAGFSRQGPSAPGRP